MKDFQSFLSSLSESCPTYSASRIGKVGKEDQSHFFYMHLFILLKGMLWEEKLGYPPL